VKLGELEREVMEVVWNEPTTEFTVREVNAHFPDHAYTTIMTVLSRLTAKGFVSEVKHGRRNTFRATASREEYITGMIMEALSSTTDRQAVLARFAESLPASDQRFIRKIFSRDQTK